MKKITLREIINGIDKDNTPKGCPNLYELCKALGVDFDSIDEISFYGSTMESYFVRPHYCTDVWVGIQAHFLDDELVAVSYQAARKADEDYFFVSNEAAEKVKRLVLSFLINETAVYNLIDLDELCNEKYSVDYNVNIVHRFGWYKGEKVKILKSQFVNWGNENAFSGVEIKLNDGSHKIVNVRELLFDYNTLN